MSPRPRPRPDQGARCAYAAVLAGGFDERLGGGRRELTATDRANLGWHGESESFYNNVFLLGSTFLKKRDQQCCCCLNLVPTRTRAVPPAARAQRRAGLRAQAPLAAAGPACEPLRCPQTARNGAETWPPRGRRELIPRERPLQTPRGRRASCASWGGMGTPPGCVPAAAAP